ncbi:MAG: PD-(D/E)XK nuclease family protein [Janthinobacterium lividum]
MATPKPLAAHRLLTHAQLHYQKAQAQQLVVSDEAYNIFTVLGIREQEVKHTALLADLLNPYGQHGLGAVFLSSFLKQAAVPTRSPAAWRVTSEENHSYGRWDIALHGQIAGRPALILIENKINAAEGHRQLDRYLQAAQEHEGAYAPADTWLIFLTPDGRAAQSCRQSNGACLLTWSYHCDIRNWLTALLPRTQPNPALHHVLRQYLDLLTEYHNHNVQQTLSGNLANHLIQHNLLAEAEAIRDALVQARIELQLLFWQELEQQLLYYKLPVVAETTYKYSRERITDCYRKSRKSRGYGIAIELLRRDRDQKQLLLWIELGKHTIGFGVYLCERDQFKSAADFRRGRFGRDQLQQFVDNLGLAIESDGALLYPPLTQCPMRFVPFELADMQQLAQHPVRLALVKAIALETKRLFTKFPR